MAAALKVYSVVSVKSQTVLPKAVRERLQIGTGDKLQYVIGDDGIRLEKAASPMSGDDPFHAFSEWSDPLDDQAYADL